MPVHHGEIDAVRLATRELHLEPLLRLPVLRKDDETRRVLVDAMDDERTPLAVGSEPVLDQLVHRKNIRLSLERYRQEAGWLVDDDQIVVFVDNVEGSRTTAAGSCLGAPWPVDPQPNDVTCDEAVRC